MIVLINFTFCLYKCFFLLLTKATTQAVHILSHPSLGVGKIICSLVEAGGRGTHVSTCPHWTNCYKGRKRWRPRVTSEAAKQGKVGRVGTRAGAADPHMIAPQKICEMLNGFVTFTQYFVTKLNLRNFSTLDSAVKNL